jgi:hypothetical protein
VVKKSSELVLRQALRNLPRAQRFRGQGKGRPRPSEEIEGMKTTSLYSGFGPARAYGEDRSFSQPDALLNDQYLENFRSKTPLEGERALLLAVLEDGVGCFQDNVLPRNRKSRCCWKKRGNGFLTTIRIGFSRSVSICATLGLEPGYIRQGLRRWQERVRAPSPKWRRSRPMQQGLVA